MKADKVYLVGFMAAGKTTLARALAKRLDWQAVDIDELIEEAVDPLRRAVAAGEPGAPDLLARAYLDSGDWPGCIEWLGPYVEQGHVRITVHCEGAILTIDF